ncbi:hypothetical protein GCM10010515_12390 [Streptomyces fructofermentans]|uniref:Uncharacterized protein n=1 Tax=Streptomyces fructofermentans TaxID=152141 RepID=A0A918N859_9ACTN|nr:hypothetical protein GCM10010515_12390 [Streptomyces fructofermentans]
MGSKCLQGRPVEVPDAPGTAGSGGRRRLRRAANAAVSTRELAAGVFRCASEAPDAAGIARGPPGFPRLYRLSRLSARAASEKCPCPVSRKGLRSALRRIRPAGSRFHPFPGAPAGHRPAGASAPTRPVRTRY